MKLEQYTKKPYPNCQPKATGYYTTEDGELYYHKGTKQWYYDEDMEDEAMEHLEYFFELSSPMEVKDAEALPLSQLGDFVDWIRDIKFKKYREGWCQEGGSNGWHCSTAELMKMFNERDVR